jgi:hypothetical protein
MLLMWFVGCSLALPGALQIAAVIVVLRQPRGQRDWNRWEIAAMIGLIAVVLSALIKQAIWKEAATPHAVDVLLFNTFANMMIFSSTMSRGRGDRV